MLMVTAIDMAARLAMSVLVEARIACDRQPMRAAGTRKSFSRRRRVRLSALYATVATNEPISDVSSLLLSLRISYFGCAGSMQPSLGTRMD